MTVVTALGINTAPFPSQRIGLALLSIWAVCTITFFIAFLAPGDPAELAAGQHSDPATIAHVRHEFGLDKPPLTRYGLYLWDAAHGDLGKSYYTREPVTDFLKRGLPNTALLATSPSCWPSSSASGSAWPPRSGPTRSWTAS